MTEQEYTTLETLIDKHGLASVLYALSHVCRERADHIRSSYSDDPLAKQWERDANKIVKCGDAVTC